MSVEEDIDSSDTELKELVTQTLEENGLLSKIKAQLRAGLYIALENEISEANQQCHIEDNLRMNLAKAEIRTVFCLVKEFLEYFGLDFTNSVFERESLMGILYDYKGKERLIKELEIGVENVTQTPLLVEILNVARNSYKHNSNFMSNETVQNASSYINESKDNINTTYDVPSKKLNSTEQENISVSETEMNNIIDVKTVPKITQNDSIDVSLSSIESKSSSKEKTPEIIKAQNTENSEKIKQEPQKFETDDTYEGTSSIAEDSIVSNTKETPLIDLDKTTKTVPVQNLPTTTFKSLLDQTIDDSSSNRSPRIDSNSDKKKHDKTKPMSGLSSLSDLPPLQITKARSPDTVLLPSLYSKEFREKSNLKEIDKLLDLNFDSIDNYEEDFILSAGIDYERNKNINSVLSKNDHNKSESKHFAPVKLFDDNKSSKNLESKKNLAVSSSSENINSDKRDGETTSISEELDFNSNSNDNT